MASKIYIMGAHSRARTLAVYIQYLYPDVTVEAYLYDNDEPNPKTIDGVKVCRMDPDVCAGLNREYPVFLGIRGVYHERLAEKFRELGFVRIYLVTVERDMKLRNAYMEKYFRSIGREFRKIDHLLPGDSGIPKESATIYVVKSVFDSTLQQEYILAPWEKEIQVGASLTNEKICELSDNTGVHISGRNRQFCELTALYWIWKNAAEEIVGLAHYRRHFILTEDWVERMLWNKVDAILPVPLYVFPNLAENYKERHDSQDWDVMMKYLKEHDAQEYEEADAFFRQNLYSPCNMLIARREVLDRLCSWLFPILFAVAGHGGSKEDIYQNRYPGFLAERLISFFFERERERYKVVYADKSFLA